MKATSRVKLKKRVRNQRVEVIFPREISFMDDTNSEYAAQVWRKIGLFGEKKSDFDYCRSKQMPKTDQMTEIPSYVRTYFWATILYKYNTLLYWSRSSSGSLDIDSHPKVAIPTGWIFIQKITQVWMIKHAGGSHLTPSI